MHEVCKIVILGTMYYFLFLSVLFLFAFCLLVFSSSVKMWKLQLNSAEARESKPEICVCMWRKRNGSEEKAIPTFFASILFGCEDDEPVTPLCVLLFFVFLQLFQLCIVVGKFSCCKFVEHLWELGEPASPAPCLPAVGTD